MDVQAIASLVSSVGFPIVMCLVLCWYVKYMTEEHKGEVDALKVSLDNNTKVLTELYTMISGGEHGNSGN